MSGVTGYTLNSMTPTVTKTGIKITSNVTFSADVPTTFLGVMGKSKMTVQGSSTSTVSLPPYLDFYLTLDVSGSMGLPSTTAESVRMQRSTRITTSSIRPAVLGLPFFAVKQRVH